jgi:hypothetical protein
MDQHHAWCLPSNLSKCHDIAFIVRLSLSFSALEQSLSVTVAHALGNKGLTLSLTLSLSHVRVCVRARFLSLSSLFVFHARCTVETPRT